MVVLILLCIVLLILDENSWQMYILSGYTEGYYFRDKIYFAERPIKEKPFKSRI
jgi:hypothetical protein